MKKLKDIQALSPNCSHTLFTKHCLLNAKSEQILCDFKTIHSACDQVKCSAKQSNIHYMELVDEHPDSNETMRFVSELLLRTASSEHQDGYVVLTGDGKHMNISWKSRDWMAIR